MNIPYYPGLEGVAAVESSLSKVNGEVGELLIAGRRVEDWCVSPDFEACLAEILSLGLNESLSREEVQLGLLEGRRQAFQWLQNNLTATASSAPLLQLVDLLTRLPGVTDDWQGGLHLIGRIAQLTASLIGVAKKIPHIAPTNSPMAKDFLWQISGVEPGLSAVKALNTYWIGISDHGLNASTFAARVVASTGAELSMIFPTAIAALSGPLHGGAPGPVLDMLDAIGTEEKALTWISQALLQGRRIMGVGHRVYKVRDPRAALFEAAATALANESHQLNRLNLARCVEETAVNALQQAKPGRRLYGNVEFYTAILLEALGIPRQWFTSTFACGRSAGWLAHSLEHRRNGRLLRPRLRYVGK